MILLGIPYSMLLVAEIGATFPQIGDGTWIQKGFAPSYDTASPSVELSLAHGRWSVGANYLLHLRSESDGVADNHYDLSAHRCVARCDYPAHFVGLDRVWGFHLTYQRPLMYGFTLEPRVYVFKAQQSVTVSNWRPNDDPSIAPAPSYRYVRHARWQLAPSIGVGWSWKRCGLVGRLYYGLSGRGDWMGTLHDDLALTASIRCSFGGRGDGSE